jgi:hypothetical protein
MLKIGDMIRIKKLSKKEFIKIYVKRYLYGVSEYDYYLKIYNKYFNNIYKIGSIRGGIICIFLNNCPVYLYPEEVQKINTLSSKIKVLKRLIE